MVIPSGDTSTVTTLLTQNLTDTGLLQVNGTLAVASTGSATFNGPVAVASGALLSVNGPVTTNGSLTLGPGIAMLTGTAALNTNGTTTVDGGAMLSDTAPLTNAGDLTVNPFGTLTVGALSNALNLDVEGSATVAGAMTNVDAVEVGGSLTVGGTLTNNDNMTVDGTLTASGLLDNEGTLKLGAGDSAAAASLQEDGTLVTQLASASSYGSLDVSGQVTFGSPNTLTVSLVGGYVPAGGTPFVVLTFGSRQGAFGNVNFPYPGWTLTYGSTSAVATS